MNKLTQSLNAFESSFKGLRQTARLVLTVAATTRLVRKQPLAVILVGGPSSGKTSVLMPLTRGKKGTTIREQVLRVDDFSGASLVSHAANRTEEQLKKQDLLPKMKDKCVIVKEMAPLFTGQEEELLRKFGVFASVLDGDGYVSSSGSHGKRGYTEPNLFSMLGAVTPNVLSAKVLTCLDAVGPRFCFWEVPTREVDPMKWTGPDETRAIKEQISADALTNYTDEFFDRFPPGSVPRDQFNMSEASRHKLSQIAVLMSALRSRGLVDRDDQGNILGYQVSPESPDRAFRYLEQIVLASALIDERWDIMDCDLELAVGIAIGSATPSRRKVIRSLMRAPGKMTIADFSETMKVTTDTASKYCDYVNQLGLIERVNYDGTIEWDLKKPFDELRYIYDPNLVHPTELEAALNRLRF